MEIRIKENNKIEELNLSDAQSGQEMAKGMIGEWASDDIDGYDDDDNPIMSQESFDWWESYMSEHQGADNRRHDARQNLGSEKAQEIELENDHLYHVEFNDMPAAMNEMAEILERAVK